MQCPTCNHVLKEEAAHLGADLPAITRASADAVPCPDCGEMVRKGLVRCWRCGGFLREEIASTYQKMQDAPRPITLTGDATHQSASQVREQPEVPESASQMVDDDDDDFELAPGYSFMSEDEASGFANAAPEPEPEPATFKISAPAAPVRPVAAASSAPQIVRSPAPTPAAKVPEPAAANVPVASVKPAAPDSVVAAPKPLTPAVAQSTTADAPPAPKPAAPTSTKFVSTGDPLLDIALKEQIEAENRRRARVKAKRTGEKVAMPGYVYVFCPNGHRIQVEERYRGLTGRCPKCQSFYHVPALDWLKSKEDEKRAAVEQVKETKYFHWALDAHLHAVDPTKLKLKPGSLEKDFQEVDIGFTADCMLIVSHGKQGSGLFKGEKNKKRKDELRAEAVEYLRLEKTLLDLPAAGYREFRKDELPRVQVVQPAAYAHESIFAGVAVFGEGRVAVRMPVTEQSKGVADILFVSFTLSEFRAFGELLEKHYGINELGGIEGVPLKDNVTTFKCHYLDRPVRSLEVTPFHKADATMVLDISGRKCQACGLVVSEEGRKKEKLGGPAGKSIGKSPCPKCKQKFGDVSLFDFKVAEQAAEPDTAMAETGGLKSK